MPFCEVYDSRGGWRWASTWPHGRSHKSYIVEVHTLQYNLPGSAPILGRRQSNQSTKTSLVLIRHKENENREREEVGDLEGSIVMSVLVNSAWECENRLETHLPR